MPSGARFRSRRAASMSEATTARFRIVSLMFTTRPASNPPRITRPTLILPMSAPPPSAFRPRQRLKNHPRGRLLLGPPQPRERGAERTHDPHYPSVGSIEEVDDG